jgi:hypothetical protein
VRIAPAVMAAAARATTAGELARSSGRELQRRATALREFVSEPRRKERPLIARGASLSPKSVARCCRLHLQRLESETAKVANLDPSVALPNRFDLLHDLGVRLYAEGLAAVRFVRIF